MLRWLLVGTGDTVRKRVGATLSGTEGSSLAAVCGRRLTAAEEIGRLFGANACFDDLARALENSGSDAVYVATPVASHVEIAAAALRAGKHVLVEKPLGVNAAECQSLVDLARDYELTAGCAYYRPVSKEISTCRRGDSIGTDRHAASDANLLCELVQRSYGRLAGRSGQRWTG